MPKVPTDPDHKQDAAADQEPSKRNDRWSITAAQVYLELTFGAAVQ